MAKKDTPLCLRQELFCKEYFAEEFNATKAAINAKYSEKTASATASRLLRDPRIKERISEIINDALGTSRDQLRYKVIKKLSDLAFGDITEDIKIITKKVKRTVMEGKVPVEKEFDIQTVEISDTKNMKHKGAIASIKQAKDGIEIKYHSADKALELLGRYGALFVDKVEIEDKREPVVFYLPDNKRDNFKE